MNADVRNAGLLVMAATVVSVLVSGCGVMKSDRDAVSNPLTPEQSKAQVVDAAREIVGALGLRVVMASFWHSSCNDQGDPPFRGEVSIGYPLAPSFQESDAEIARMVQRLQSIGWTADPGFHTHGIALQKNNVVAVFGPQDISGPNRGIDVLGECRDVTTTKQTAGSTEDVTLN